MAKKTTTTTTTATKKTLKNYKVCSACKEHVGTATKEHCGQSKFLDKEGNLLPPPQSKEKITPRTSKTETDKATVGDIKSALHFVNSAGGYDEAIAIIKAAQSLTTTLNDLAPKQKEDE